MVEMHIRPDWLARVQSLLERIAGPDQAGTLLDRLVKTDGPLPDITKEIAETEAFAQLFKLVRTSRITSSGSRVADPSYVGVADLDLQMPFDKQFECFFRPRLQQRADGFAAIFEAIARRHQRPLIVETGCFRRPGNWAGDGQSTFMFDAFASYHRGTVMSIDVTAESIDSARRACSSTTQLILNDSVAALHALSRFTSEPISLLYLDSFDLDPANPMPSAIHHLKELAAARPLIGPGTVICIDDYAVGEAVGGKGFLVDNLLTQLNLRVLFSGYQKVWLFE